MQSDLDLSFYQHLSGAAHWTCVAGTRNIPIAPDTWMWEPTTQLSLEADLDDIDALIADDWRPVSMAPGEGLQEIMLPLHGQLGHSLTVIIAGSQERQLWAPRADLERVRAMPVVLSFTVPDDLATRADTIMPGVQRLTIIETLPPPQFGEVAFVMHSVMGHRGWRRYTVDQLGEDMQALQCVFAESMRKLEMGGVGWVSATPAYKVVARGQFERGMALARNMAANERQRVRRERLQLNVELLDLERQRYELMQAARKRFSREHWLEVWEVTRQYARDLAASYWERHQEVTAEEARVASRRGQITQLPLTGLKDGQLEIPTEVPILAFLNAYSQASAAARKGPVAILPKVTPDLATATRGWAHESSGLPVFVHQTDKYRTELHMVPPDSAERDAATLEPEELSELAAHVWGQVAALDDTDGDILLARLAHYLTSEKDENGRTWITAEHVLRYRGIEAKVNREGDHSWDGGMRREDLALIGKHSARLDTQWVTLSKKTTAGGDVSWKSALFIVPEKLTYRQLVTAPEAAATTGAAAIELPAGMKLTGRALIEAMGKTSPAGGVVDFDIAWLYQPGTWWQGIEYDDAGRVHMEHISQRILAYDPYHEQWEKRLARYAFFHLRMNATSGHGTIKRRIRDLFTDLGLPTDERDPKRTRTRFEQAMKAIQADGCIDDWRYADGEPSLPARGWLGVWLDLSVKMTAPPLVREHYAQMAADRAAKIAQLHPTRRNQKRARETLTGVDARKPKRNG